MPIVVDDEKRKRVENLVKSFREIDNAILPFREQRTELRKSYVENGWLTKDEFTLVKKAYNALKTKVDMDDLSTVVDIARKEMP
jgi:hypothetical protein